MKFLFDLGGVFFDWDPKYFYHEVFDTEEERKYFLTVVCNDEWNVKQDAGRSFQEAEAELIPIFPQYEREIKMYYKNHRKMIRGTFDLSIKVLEKLKKQNYKCFVLSNWSAETFYGPVQTMINDYSFLTHLYITPHPYVFGKGISLFSDTIEESNLIFEKIITVYEKNGIFQYQYKINK